MVRFFHVRKRGATIDNRIIYDYFYGDESEQFSYYRIPRLLVTGIQFKHLSTDAKLLYGLLLDRMGLSIKNSWYDELGRVYIYYPLDEIQDALNCSRGKAIRLFAELDTTKGVGLIERVRQGQGKPAKIYVKRFTTRNVPSTPEPPEDEQPPRLPETEHQEVPKENVLTFQNRTSRSSKAGLPDVPKLDGSYIKYNYPDFIYTDPSIHPSNSPPIRGMDRRECREEIKYSIAYDQLKERYGRENVDAILNLITDVLCSTRATIRIGGEQLPIETVKDRFWQLDQSHVEYVFDCLQKNTTKIHNIRGYLLTSLYNAPVTIEHYYQAEVQHDLYGQ